MELDCGAQSSILSQELVDRLNLQTFQIDGSYQVSFGCTPFFALRGFQERFTGIFNPILGSSKIQTP